MRQTPFSARDNPGALVAPSSLVRLAERPSAERLSTPRFAARSRSPRSWNQLVTQIEGTAESKEALHGIGLTDYDLC